MHQIQAHQALTVPQAYAWFREHAGDTATQAIRHARTAVAFFAAPGDYADQDDDALVRLAWEPEFECHDASYVDSWPMSDAKKERQKKEIFAMIERDGLWILCAQWRPDTDSEWETVDSIGDMVGDDYSGYEPELMQAALDALDAYHTEEASELADRPTFAGVSP